MRKLALLLTLVVTISATAQSNKKESAFTEYTSAEDKYTIYFPGKNPKEATKKLNTNAGEMNQSTVSYEGKDATFAVTVTELPRDVARAGLKVLADGVRDGMKEKTGKVEADKEVTHGEGALSGREIQIDFGRNVARTRVFVVGSRLYQVTVTGSKAVVTNTTADKFITSFGIKE